MGFAMYSDTFLGEEQLKTTLYEPILIKAYGKHVFTGHYVQLLKYESMKI